MSQSQTQPVVLVVEDESDIAESYELWLTNEYEVHRVDTGEEALSKLDALSVDVVLLDRMLPGMSGDEVLEEIRLQDHHCRVAMVSAVQPGIDVVEMGFDGYITKPPGKDELRETVEGLLARSTLDEDLQEYYSLLARQSALESEFSEEALAKKAEYHQLIERIETYRTSIAASIPDLASDTDFVGAVREIDAQPSTEDEHADQSDGTDRE